MMVGLRIFWVLFDVFLFLLAFKWLINNVKEKHSFRTLLSVALIVFLVLCTIADAKVLICVLNGP